MNLDLDEIHRDDLALLSNFAARNFRPANSEPDILKPATLGPLL
jgi:hypothetical protein